MADLKTVTVTGVPEFQGRETAYRDGRYRVWTVQHGLHWRQRFGGPDGWILTTLDGWNVNPMNVVRNAERGGWDTLPGGEVSLSVFRTGQGERHPELDGQRFASWEEAYDEAWAAGLLGLHVYDSSADRHGLLNAAIDFENAEQDAGRLAEADRRTGRAPWDCWLYKD